MPAGAGHGSLRPPVALLKCSETQTPRIGSTGGPAYPPTIALRNPAWDRIFQRALVVSEVLVTERNSALEYPVPGGIAKCDSGLVCGPPRRANPRCLRFRAIPPGTGYSKALWNILSQV